MMIEKAKEEGVKSQYREGKKKVIEEIIKKGLWPSAEEAD